MSWEDFNTEARVTGIANEIEALFPPILYKYRTWANPLHQTILTQQQVYFSPAEDFPDPSDCRFPVEHHFSVERTEAIARYDIRVNKNLAWTEEQIKALARYHFNEAFGTPEKQELKKREFYQLFNHNVGILCLCQKNNVPSMWGEYGQDFNGFCVGLSLSAHYEELMRNFIFGGYVTYVDLNFPPLKYVWADEAKGYDMELFFLRLITTKYENFKHEDEYRLCKYFPNRLRRIITPQDRLFTVPKSAYKEVIFGSGMTKPAINEVIEVCENQNLKVQYLMASPNSDDYANVEPYHE